jgi:hypothetical protein
MISKHRKLSLSVIAASALCVLAFAAVPAMASAAGVYSPAKTLIKVGTSITFKSTNATQVLNGIGTLSCTNWEFYGIVEKNNGVEVEIGPDGTPSAKAEGCNLNGVRTAYGPWLTSMVLTNAGNKVSFGFTAPGWSESSTSTVTYAGPATNFRVSGPLTGTLSGTFTGDFTAKVNSTGHEVIFN